MTRCPKISSTPALASDDFALAHHDGAISIPNNVWQCSDNTEETFLDHLTPDFPYGTIDTVLVDESADLEDDLMRGQSYASASPHANSEAYYSSSVARSKRSYTLRCLAQ
jgi:hypothetical protein